MFQPGCDVSATMRSPVVRQDDAVAVDVFIHSHQNFAGNDFAAPVDAIRSVEINIDITFGHG